MLTSLAGCYDGGGSAHNCGHGCVEEAKVLAFSECGGFADRNVTDINLSHDNTYIAYNVVNNQKTLYFTQYNAAVTCEDIKSLGMGANFFNPVEVGLGVTTKHSCYCLRDVQMKIVLDRADSIYPVVFKSAKKGENDPDIKFTIDTDKNSSGIVSFSRSVEPWGE